MILNQSSQKHFSEKIKKKTTNPANIDPELLKSRFPSAQENSLALKAKLKNCL